MGNIDVKFAEALFNEIRKMEITNSKTRKFEDKDMVRMINDRIRRRVKDKLEGKDI